MGRFILYLFETGLCLFLLYAAYWLFLRKETYFNFNRIFLVGSIVLALTVPLLHLNFRIKADTSLEESAVKILKVRNYYKELVAMIDADFGAEPSEVGGNRREFADYQSLSERIVGGVTGQDQAKAMEAGTDGHGRSRVWSVSGLFLIIYLGGFFTFYSGSFT